MDQAVMDLLSSDVRIVDSTSRTATPEGVSLRFPGHLMPDGKEVVGESPGQLTPAILRNWCTMVRSEFDARQSRKDAEEVRAASVREQGGTQGDQPSREHVPASSGAQGDGEGSEASVDEYLKSEVAKWARVRLRLTEELASHNARLTAATAALRNADARHLMAQKLLAFHLSQEDNGIASEDL